MPPRSLRSCVYVTEPTRLSTSLSARRWSKLSAPAPDTSSLLKEVSSKRQAPSRAARCSPSIAVDQWRDDQPRGVQVRGECLAFASSQFGRSHPAFSPKAAPSASTRAWAGERLSPRPVDQRDDLGAPDGRHA